jgi:outer membrane cobalamin receptor
MIYATWRSNITGKRYTTADNSKFLPAFFVNNVSSGINYDNKWGVMDVNLEIMNLLNVDYQTIAYYPLPGRTYMLKIMFQIFK